MSQADEVNPPGKPKSANADRFGLLTACLGILGLNCLAVAQPLVDLIRRNPEFLSIRGHTLGDILIVLAFLMVIVPLPALTILALVGRRWPTRLHQVAAVLAGLFMALILLQLFRDSSVPTLWSVGLVLALAAGWLYAKVATVRSFVLFLSPVLLLVPATFLLDDDVRRALASDSSVGETFRSGARAPIIFIVFDEWSLSSILNEQGDLDRERLPNIARLADQSTWYRRAMGVSDATEIAVPALLSGTFPNGETLPILADHPVNLFTLFGDYSIYCEEPLTRLCPAELNRVAFTGGGTATRLRSLARDLPILWLHETVPVNLGGALPPLEGRWSNFANEPSAEATSPSLTDEGAASEESLFSNRALMRRAAKRLRGGARKQDFNAFLDRLEESPRKSLHFIHSLLPHTPWEYLPSGKRYISDEQVLGLERSRWTDRRGMDFGLQRYLLQVGFVDTLIGQLLDRLAELDRLEESMIVITADHGVSFQHGVSRRLLVSDGTQTPLNAAGVAFIPLFIKEPGQTAGGINEEVVPSTRVLPLVLEKLKVEPPKAFTPSSRSAGAFQAKHSPFLELELPESVHQPELAQRVATLADASDPWQLKLASDLVGKAVSDLEIAQSESEITLDGVGFHPNFDPDQEFSPSYTSGSIEHADEWEDPPIAAAIVVNGVVRATGHVIETGPNKSQFAAMVPESAFAPGLNQVSVLLVRSVGAELVLESGQQGLGIYSLLRNEAGAPIGLRLGERELGLVSTDEDLQGFLDRQQTQGNLVSVLGWAADRRPGSQIETVAIFLDDELIAQGAPTVTETEGAPTSEPVRARFRFDLSAKRLEGMAEKGLLAVAIASDGRAKILAPRLLPIATESGQTVLELTSGKQFRVVEGAVIGSLDRWELGDDFNWHGEGWAAEADEALPAANVAVFRDGQPVRTDPLAHPRPEVASKLNRPELEISGFKLQFPQAWAEEIRSGKIKVYGLSHGDLASELTVVAPKE